MTTRTLVTTSFSGGEVSPSTFSRTDLQNYYSLASKMENMAITGAGTVEKRAGSFFVANDATKELNALIGQYPVTTTASQGIEQWAFDADEQYVIANSLLPERRRDEDLANGSVVELPTFVETRHTENVNNKYSFVAHSFAYRDGIHVNGWYYAPRFDGIPDYSGDIIKIRGHPGGYDTINSGDMTLRGFAEALEQESFYEIQKNLTHDICSSGNLAVQSWPFPSQPQVIIRKGDDTTDRAFEPAAANFIDGPYFFANGDQTDDKKCWVIPLTFFGATGGFFFEDVIDDDNEWKDEPRDIPIRDNRAGQFEDLGFIPRGTDGEVLPIQETVSSFSKTGGLAEIRWNWTDDPKHPNNVNPPLQNIKIGSPIAFVYTSRNKPNGEDGSVVVDKRCVGTLVAKGEYTNADGVTKATNSAVIRWTVPPDVSTAPVSTARSLGRGTSEWFLGCDVNGGITASTFFQGRYFFSLKQHPNRIFATRVNGWGRQEKASEVMGTVLQMNYPVNGFEDLDCGQSSRADVVSIVDTDGLDIALDSGLSEPVESFVADERGLLAFTRSNVFLIQGGGGAGLAITPTSFSVSRQSRIGCVDRCPAQSVQDVTVFTGPDGKGLYAVSYNNNREKYSTLEVSVTSQHLFQRPGGQIVELTSENVPRPKITGIQRDGGVTVFSYSPSTSVNAFSTESYFKINPDTKIKDLTTIYETRTNFQYRLLAKNISSLTSQFFVTRASVIEDYSNELIDTTDFSVKTFTEPTIYLDFAARVEVVGSLPSTITMDPEFFANRDGEIAICVYDQQTATWQFRTGLSSDANGVVNVPSDLVAPTIKGRVYAGFPYTSKLHTAPIQNLTGAVRRGTADHNRQKRIVKAFVRLIKSTGGKAGVETLDDLLYRKPTDQMSKLVPEFTGAIEVHCRANSLVDPIFKLEHNIPMRFEVGSIALEIDAGGIS